MYNYVYQNLRRTESSCRHVVTTYTIPVRVFWTNNRTDAHLQLRQRIVTQIFDKVEVNQSNNKVV
jgi:hypothetical protein